MNCIIQINMKHIDVKFVACMTVIVGHQSSIMSLQFLLLLISLPYSISQDNFNCQRCGTSDAGTAICKTDEYCQFFNDCCCEDMSSDESEKLSLSLLNSTAEFTCQSTFTDPDLQVIAANEAFLMISSCPGSWVNPENSTIESNCIQPSPPLPPVTDTSTGLVYRNEYCALCHQVTTFSLWESKLLCNEVVHAVNEAGNLWSTLRYDPAILQRHCAVCSFAPPPPPPPASRNEGTMYSLRSCIPYNDTCPPQNSWQRSTSTYNDLVQTCTRGSKNLVLSNGIVYHNEACVQCNGLRSAECFQLSTSAGSMQCYVPPPHDLTTRINRRLTFAITLSNLGGTDAKVSTIKNEIEVSFNCSDGEVLVALQCRPLHCPSGYLNAKGKCTFISIQALQVHNITLSNCSRPLILDNTTSYTDLHNDTVVLSDKGLIVEVLNYDKLGRPIVCLYNDSSYLNCNSTFVKLNKDEYEDLLNGSILFQSRVLDVMFNDSEDGLPLICFDLIRPTTRLLFEEDLPGIQELTYISCSLSVFGTVAVIFTYSVFKELQTFPGLVLVNVCVPLFFTSLIFIIGGPVLQSYPIKELCSISAISLHFFYLSQFSWMTIFSFETTKTFYQARQLIQNTKHTKYKYFVSYFLISWISPLIICTTTTVLNFTTGLVRYGVNGRGEFTCWINHYEFLIASFLLPLVFSLTGNLLFLVITSVLLYRAYKDQSKVGKSNIATMIRVWLALFTITGLTWSFGFLALINEISWMWYFFTIFNSTQGFSVFLSLSSLRKCGTFTKDSLKS